MDEKQACVEKWEEAYSRQIPDATLGRLFRGIVHNLNGIVQAFAMQTGLFEVMFQQADERFAKLLEGGNAGNQELEALREFLRGRAAIIPGVEEKIGAFRSILPRISDLGSFQEDKTATPVNEIVAVELEFLAGNMFFKHKVKKELHLGEKLPLIMKGKPEIHLALHAIMENALDALEGKENPKIFIETACRNGRVEIMVRDSGGGLPASTAERIFEPFFTTKPGNSGLGLYFARKMMERCGGGIRFAPEEAETCFVLSLP